jgi:hypothetical protein
MTHPKDSSNTMIWQLARDETQSGAGIGGEEVAYGSAKPGPVPDYYA